MGGDEVNIILPGRNYGWPVVSYAREYHGPRASERPWQEGMELPELAWIPSIAPTGILFYTGDRFPAWKGNLFVGSLMTGRIERTGHLERVARLLLQQPPAGDENHEEGDERYQRGRPQHLEGCVGKSPQGAGTGAPSPEIGHVSSDNQTGCCWS